jgi:hypothetical protein
VLIELGEAQSTERNSSITRIRDPKNFAKDEGARPAAGKPKWATLENTRARMSNLQKPRYSLSEDNQAV